VVPVFVVAGKAVDNNGNGQGEGKDAQNGTESSQNPPETSLNVNYNETEHEKFLSSCFKNIFTEGFMS
jgi:hypothetical protein